MANGFGSMFIGVAGLQSSQNALNVTANNLSNVDTAGYVRQRVLFTDRDYQTFNTTAAISRQQSGLGVKIGDVIHTRDIFLDRSYRTETGRQAFYAATSEAASEVETYFQEMEGQAFQDAIEDFWKSFQEFYKDPADSVNQDLVLQKAQLFISRASAVYSGLKSYQYNINTQISDDIDQVNNLGKSIHELNLEIQKVEAGDIETAMTLRDARDQALDELANLVDISYTETVDGAVVVSVEGTEFINEAGCHEIGEKRDKLTGFITPYWPHLSDEEKNKYVNVFNFNTDISTENKNDMGELKALVLARGDHIANYQNIEGLDKDVYNDTTGMSVMLTAQAELDQLIHGIITAINDVFCPNVSASSYIPQLAPDAAPPVASITVRAADGTEYQVTKDTLILDADKCAVGSREDGETGIPPQEMFSRIGTERYTKVTDDAGNVYYLYNEEDPNNTAKQYTLESVSVNDVLVGDKTKIPHKNQNGTINYEMAAKLGAIWEEDRLILNPNDTKKCSFKSYYQSMINEMATFGDVYSSTATSLANTVASIDNARQQVIGVSSDEELAYMIRFQNAYNASSRFINVINEMIEHLITQLG